MTPQRQIDLMIRNLDNSFLLPISFAGHSNDVLNYNKLLKNHNILNNDSKAKSMANDKEEKNRNENNNNDINKNKNKDNNNHKEKEIEKVKIIKSLEEKIKKFNGNLGNKINILANFYKFYLTLFR
jgi:hypothetical protein